MVDRSNDTLLSRNLAKRTAAMTNGGCCFMYETMDSARVEPQNSASLASKWVLRPIILMASLRWASLLSIFESRENFTRFGAGKRSTLNPSSINCSERLVVFFPSAPGSTVGRSWFNFLSVSRKGGWSSLLTNTISCMSISQRAIFFPN